MTSDSGQWVLAFNGEIYNHPDIRAELAAIGHFCKGRSDTEVLLEACEVWGVRRAIERVSKGQIEVHRVKMKFVT